MWLLRRVELFYVRQVNVSFHLNVRIVFLYNDPVRSQDPLFFYENPVSPFPVRDWVKLKQYETR